MNNLVGVNDPGGVKLLSRAQDFGGVMSRSFVAESEGRAAQETALSDLLAWGERLGDLKREVELSLRPATNEEIASQLTLLMGAFPNAGKDDRTIFGRVLVEDVIAQRPGILPLLQGISQVRRTSKFLPSIAEVLEAITGVERRLHSTLVRIADYPLAVASLESCLKGR